jgi:hypothetical protein
MAWGKTSAQDIERLQKKVFRLILPGMGYCEALDHLKIQTLRERCEKHCVELITKLSSPEHRLHHLLPERVGEIRDRS